MGARSTGAGWSSGPATWHPLHLSSLGAPGLPLTSLHPLYRWGSKVGTEQSPQWALWRQVACDRAFHSLGVKLTLVVSWASVSLRPNLQCHLNNAVWGTGELSGLCPASPSGSILPTLQSPVALIFDLQLKGRVRSLSSVLEHVRDSQVWGEGPEHERRKSQTFNCCVIGAL